MSIVYDERPIGVVRYTVRRRTKLGAVNLISGIVRRQQSDAKRKSFLYRCFCWFCGIILS